MIAETVYILCAAVSMTCMFLLWRGWKRSSNYLLFWSSICFAGFTLNSIMVFIDIVALPTEIDLSAWRLVPAMLGVTGFIYGLSRQVRR